MYEVEFLDPEPDGDRPATQDIPVARRLVDALPNIGPECLQVIGGALGIYASFQNVYGSDVRLTATSSPFGYRYGFDGWGNLNLVPFSGSQFTLPVQGMRFGFALVVCAALAVSSGVFSLLARRRRLQAGVQFLAVASGGALLAVGTTMILAMEQARTLSGPGTSVTVTLGPSVWITWAAGLSCLVGSAIRLFKLTPRGAMQSPPTSSETASS